MLVSKITKADSLTALFLKCARLKASVQKARLAPQDALRAPVWVLSLSRLARVSILPEQPVLQVLQPLGVDCECLTLLGQRKQVHITHCLSIIIILFGGQDKQQGTQRQRSRWHRDDTLGSPPGGGRALVMLYD